MSAWMVCRGLNGVSSRSRPECDTEVLASILEPHGQAERAVIRCDNTRLASPRAVRRRFAKRDAVPDARAGQQGSQLRLCRVEERQRDG